MEKRSSRGVRECGVSVAGAACARSGFGRWSHGGMSATSETMPMKSTMSSAGVSQLHSGHTATFRLHAHTQHALLYINTAVAALLYSYINIGTGNRRTLGMNENAV